MEKNHRVNGSGVLIWEQYKNTQNGHRGLCVTLFGSHRKCGLVFSDCGGGLDNNETAEVCALRELKEESCNLFHLNALHLGCKVQHKEYVCFNVFVNSPSGQLSSTLFKNNVKAISSVKSPHAWRESKSMSRFFINDIANMLAQEKQNYHAHAITANNENVLLHSRVVGVLKKILKLNLVDFQKQTINAPAIQLQLKPYIPSSTNPTLQFLQGTQYFCNERVILDQQESTNYQLDIYNSIEGNLIKIQEKIDEKQINLDKEKNARRGGGVILLITSEGQTGFVLVKDKKDRCNDMGGVSEPTEITLQETAIRELREETSNSLNISSSQLNSSIAIKLNNYMCYLVHFEVRFTELKTIFEKNRQILTEIGDTVPNCWKSKKDMLFFPIQTNTAFFGRFDAKANEFYMQDINGNTHLIRDRTALAVNQVFSQKTHLTLKPSQLELFPNQDNYFIFNYAYQFLAHTSSFHVKNIQ